MAHSISRRETLGAVAAGLAPKPAAAIPVGVATNDFRDHSNASLAAELKSQGIKLIQLFFTQSDSNYWKYGGRSDLPA